jgi:simple sugar transport system substrate-binding protein
MKKLLTFIFAFTLLSFGSVKAIDKDSDNDWSDINILFLIWTAEDVEFFVPSINGAHDAAEDQGISMYMEFGDSDTAKTNDIIETAIANDVDGIAMTVWDDDAFDEIVCKAMEAGIPVVLHNIDDSQRARGNCRMAYIGQFFYRNWTNIS